MVFKQELKKFKWGWGFMKPFLKPIIFLTALSGIATFIDTLEPFYTLRSRCQTVYNKHPFVLLIFGILINPPVSFPFLRNQTGCAT